MQNESRRHLLKSFLTFSFLYSRTVFAQILPFAFWKPRPSDLFTWGDNTYGQLSNGASGAGIGKSSPVQVGSIGWNETGSGREFAIITKTDGTLWSWGRNVNGELGDGTTSSRSSPVQIGVLTDWNRVAGGANHSCAIKNDGTLWLWGKNNTGQLGDGTITSKSSPAQMGANTWTKVVAGDSHTVAIRSDGSLWAWGENTDGQLGQSTTTAKRSSPVQIGALTTWTKTSAGASHSLAVRSDGTLWAWGGNTFGQLGIGNQTYKSSPTQVGSLTTWQDVACGGDFSAALKTDGTLWAMGYNGEYEVGDGTTTHRSSPVQIGTGFSAVAAGNSHGFAIKSDGTLWTWGYGGDGQTGTGNTTNRISPIQIGTKTTWLRVAAGSNHSLGICSARN